MALGLCCQWLEMIKGKPKNILPSRALRLGRYNDGEYDRYKIQHTYIVNVVTLVKVFREHIVPSGIKSFRVSSSMFPLFDKVDAELWQSPAVTRHLKKIGEMALKHGIRLTTHPGQFTVLSSDKAQTVLNAIQELEMHSWVFDEMGLPQTPYYSINIHGGKSGRSKALIEGINRLNAGSRARLTLENCEFAYSVADLLPISEATGVPICYDSHHHTFNTGGLSGEDAMNKAIATWPEGCKPNTHISNAKPEYRDSTVATKRRQHSDYLYQVPEHQFVAHNTGVIDMDVEAKMKNLAIFQAVDELDLRLS